jgi:hypothetical protein
MEKLLGKCARLLRNWKLLNKTEEATKLEEWVQELERRSARPPHLALKQYQQGSMYNLRLFSFPNFQDFQEHLGIDNFH